jgi:hypothetical protein
MTATVLIGDADRRVLKWPQRCPRCGATDFLVSLDIRVLRIKRRRRANESAVGYFFSAQEWPEGLRIAVPMCPRHARSNRLGGALLRDDTASAFLRDSIYLCFALTVLGFRRPR